MMPLSLTLFLIAGILKNNIISFIAKVSYYNGKILPVLQIIWMKCICAKQRLCYTCCSPWMNEKAKNGCKVTKRLSCNS